MASTPVASTSGSEIVQATVEPINIVVAGTTWTTFQIAILVLAIVVVTLVIVWLVYIICFDYKSIKNRKARREEKKRINN